LKCESAACEASKTMPKICGFSTLSRSPVFAIRLKVRCSPPVASAYQTSLW
jgi:hypothetical protein